MNHRPNCLCGVCINRRAGWQRYLNKLGKREELPKPQPDDRNWIDAFRKQVK